MHEELMSEREALATAWSFLHKYDLHHDVTGLKSIRLSRAAEVREVLGSEDPDLTDTWYVSFGLKLAEQHPNIHPDDLLITIDDHTGVATLVYQM